MNEINKALWSEAAPAVWKQAKQPYHHFMERKPGSALFSFKEEKFDDMIKSIKSKDGKGLSPGEVAMLKSLNERNLISVTLAFEVMNIAQQGNPTWQKAVKGFMWPAQNLELANRLATGLASYRIAKADGMPDEAATEYAAEVVTETQVDYSESNRPKLMSSKTLGNFSPLAMFQMYRQNMLWNVTYYGMKALKGDAEAKRFFAGMMLTHGLLAGVKGLPIIGGLAWLVSMMIDAADDEDDPEYNPWEETRLGLAEFVGNDIASMLIYGAPRGVGIDTHGRLGLNGLFVSEYTKMGLGRDAAASMIASIAGVPGTMFMDLSEAAKQVSQGDYLRATKTVSPKLLKDTIKSGEHMTTGLTTRQGYVAVEPSLYNSLIQFIGFTPAEVADYYAAREVEKAVSEKTRSLKAELSEDAFDAIVAKDAAALAAVERRADKAGIPAKSLKQSVRSKLREEEQYRKSKLGLSPRESETMGKYFAPYDVEKTEE
jgi:hypothetical protein